MPVSQLEMPSQSRMIRPIAEKFVESLMDEITLRLKEIMRHFLSCAKIANPRLTLELLTCICIHMRLSVAHIIQQLQRNLIYSFLKTPIISSDMPELMLA